MGYQKYHIDCKMKEIARDGEYRGIVTLATDAGYVDIRWTFNCTGKSPPSVVFTNGSGDVTLFNSPGEEIKALLYITDVI